MVDWLFVKGSERELGFCFCGIIGGWGGVRKERGWEERENGNTRREGDMDVSGGCTFWCVRIENLESAWCWVLSTGGYHEGVLNCCGR